MNLDGCAVVVTGGASGLGAATARHLAAAGARVAVLDRDEARGAEVAQAIGGVFAAADVADEASVTAALDAAAQAHGQARVLVNCAGVALGRRTVGKEGPHPLADFERVVRVNLIGTFNCIRLAAARMSTLEPLADGERGVIVSTASVAAFEGQIGQAAYAASKGGVAAMTVPIARDLANVGIRLCTIAPGIFATPMMQSLPDEVQQALGASVPFPRRLGKPEEYAMLVQHICENPMLNGATIRLDGALRLPPK